MKKISLILAACLAMLSVVSCGETADSQTESTKQTTTAETATTTAATSDTTETTTTEQTTAATTTSQTTVTESETEQGTSLEGTSWYTIHSGVYLEFDFGKDTYTITGYQLDKHSGEFKEAEEGNYLNTEYEYQQTDDNIFMRASGSKESEKDWAYRIKDGNLELCDLNHFQGGFDDVDELLSQNQDFGVSLAYYVYKPLKDFTSDDENSFLESIDGEWYKEGKDQLIDFDKSKMQVYNDGFDVYYGLYESPVENSVITGPGPEQEFVYLLNYAELIDDDTLLLGEGMTEYNVYHRR